MAAEMLQEIRPDVTLLNGEYAEEERRQWIDKLHERWPGSRVIDVHRMQVWSATSEQADATLTKPFHADTLVEAINDLVDDGH
jgi:DNA-binding NarL/FixJ family response regulator